MKSYKIFHIGLLFLLFSVTILQEAQMVNYKPIIRLLSGRCEIIFVSVERSPDTQSFERIFIANITSGNLRQLTNERGFVPTWSPDGERVAFVSPQAPNHLYVIDQDGTNLHSLAQHVYWRDSLSWSPDGKYIAYISDNTFEDDGYSKLYVVSLNEGTVQLSGRTGYHSDPVWSPDSKNIAFVVSIELDSTIYVVNVNNHEQQILVEGGLHQHPVWSPDGKQIAFSVRNKDDMNIHVVNADSSNEHILADDNGLNIVPEWSPDGSRLSFISIGDNNEWQIYLIDADGTNLQLLVDVDATSINSPVWSPDSNRIAFIADTPTGNDIWITNVDGRNLQNLGYEAYQQVRWSPQCGANE
jgi:TolB protein